MFIILHSKGDTVLINPDQIQFIIANKDKTDINIVDAVITVDEDLYKVYDKLKGFNLIYEIREFN